MNSLEQLLQIYDEVELAILFDWLGIHRPEPLADIALHVHDHADSEDSSSGRIRLVKSCYTWLGEENALSSAVARLVPSEIQCRLPQWGVVHEDGSVKLARDYAPRRQAKVDFMPRYPSYRAM